MNIKNLKSVFKKRWKFYLIGYILGYIVPIMMDGVPSYHYLFPFRFTSLFIGLLLGTSLYYGSIKMSRFESLGRSIKYFIFMLITLGVLLIINCITTSTIGYNILPLLL